MQDFSVAGLGVTCSPQDARFAGSNAVMVDGFFQDVKSPLGGTLGHGFRVCFMPEKIGI